MLWERIHFLSFKEIYGVGIGNEIFYHDYFTSVLRIILFSLQPDDIFFCKHSKEGNNNQHCLKL